MTTFIDSFAEEVWTQTYKDYKDNNIDDNLHRVAKSIAPHVPRKSDNKS
jgi:hypothetical protein